VPTEEPALQARAVTPLPLSELTEMTEEEFRVAFKGSAVKRAKWRGLRRNVAAALAVSDDPAAEAALLGALDHPEELIGQQAAIALDALRASSFDQPDSRVDCGTNFAFGKRREP
jgi:epoxyqueuosine reductase QueG